jgi:hypothetical protein
MKRRFLFMLSFLLILLPCRAAAQTMTPSVFAFAGFRIATGLGGPGALVTGFGVSFPLARKTHLGITLGFSRSAADIGGEGSAPVPLTRATSSPLFIYLRQELFGTKHLSTYASLSAGVDVSGLRSAGWGTVPENAVTRSVAPSFLLRAAGGLTLAVLSHVRFFAEGAYLSGKATGKTQVFFLRRLIVEKSFRFDIKAVQLCLGAQFYF